MSRMANAFVIYQGCIGDAGAHAADVILPGAAYTEKDATYVNTEGRAQRAQRAVFAPGEGREDWSIVRALSGALGAPLPFDDLLQLRAAMQAAAPALGDIDAQAPGEWGVFGVEGAIGPEPFQSAIKNFYMTDPISRASPTMAKCTAEFGVNGSAERTEAHG